MNKRLLGCVLFPILYIANVGQAETLYEENFESGEMKVGTVSPKYSVQPQVADRLGAGNFFEVVKGVAHSGSYSLRFNYEGRNGFCNTCGKTNIKQLKGVDSNTDVVTATGEDLALAPYNAKAGRIIYNESRGFSKWQIQSLGNHSAKNDKLEVKLLAGNLNGSSDVFIGGDSVGVYRQCGVDGNVGGNIDRRMDCDIAISYLNDLVPQAPGKSLFRRIYFMIPKDTILPYNQKMRYWVTETGSAYLTLRDTNNEINLYLEGRSVFGPGLTKVDTAIERGVWYYLEEEFKAESSLNANDGAYRLWISKSGSERTNPAVNLTNIHMGPLSKTSLWGNQQHTADSVGYWYFDDYKIADNYVGPISATSKATLLPPPAVYIKKL